MMTKSIRIRFVATLCIAFCAIALGGCHNEDTVSSGEGRGVVLRVDTAHQSITLDHGMVQSLMQPFVMSYPVDSLSTLLKLRVNDSVRFTLTNLAPGKYLVTDIHRLKPPKKK